MKKIKICSVDEDGRFGGPQARILEIEKYINKKKFSTYYIIPKEKKIFENKLKKINAEYTKINLSRLSKNIFELCIYIFSFFPEILYLAKKFKEKNFDLIQANGVTHIKTIIAAKISNIQSIWIIEDSYSPKIIVVIFKLLAKISNCKIVYISKKVFNFYLKNSDIKKNNLNEIMSPTDTNFFKRRDTKKKNKEIIITTVSNLTKVKGVETFLEVAKNVLNKNFFTKFYFVGGEVKNQKSYAKKIFSIHHSIKNQIKDRIIFKGMVLNVKKILKNTDIFVCTSRSEGGPIALWEAMSMNIPVVSTKVGGATQYIRNGENGYLCNVGDSKAISKKVLKLISDQKLRKEIGFNARKIIQKKIDSLKITKKYEKLYIQSISRN